MNPRLFGAIVIVGAGIAGVGVAGCRTGILSPPDLAVATARDMAAADQGRADLASVFDQAGPVDLAGHDLAPCCVFPNGPPADLSGCIPIACILL